MERSTPKNKKNIILKYQWNMFKTYSLKTQNVATTFSNYKLKT